MKVHLSFLATNCKNTCTWDTVACENSRFSSLLAAWYISQGETSATHRQKFHTDDVNQCLHNKSGSHGVPNTDLFNFTFLLVDFGKVLCSAVNELQKNLNASSGEEYTVIHKYWLFCYRFIAFKFDLCGLLSFVCHSTGGPNSRCEGRV